MRLIMAVLACALLILAGCQESGVERGTWVPTLEDTGFSYLKMAGQQLQVTLSELQSDLNQGNIEDACQKIAKAQKHTHALIYYDIPITEIRQLIYDAGRLHALNRHDETFEYLNRADYLLGEIGSHNNSSLQQALQEPRVMIEKLRETLELERQTTSTKYQVTLSRSSATQFSELGHKVNLMAIKGDLILSGLEFNQTKQNFK